MYISHKYKRFMHIFMQVFVTSVTFYNNTMTK